MKAPAALLLVLGALSALRATALSPLDPGAPLKRTVLTRAWTVQAPGAVSGDAVWLVIPDPVHAGYRGNYSALHVEAQGREVRYEVKSTPEPVPWVSRLEERPRPTEEAGVSQIDLPPLAPGLPLRAVHLRARPTPFYRKVQVVDGSKVLSEGGWLCLLDPPRPCELDLATGSVFDRSSHLSLRFLDGNNPPLPAINVTVWRQRESLAFVWPLSGPVHLLTEAESTVFSARNDDDLYREIDSRPSRRAWVEVPRQTGRSATPAFGAAGALLLAFVGRRLRRRLRPSAGALILTMLACLPGIARANGGRLYSRPVEVLAAGVVRVPLDLSTLRHLGANGEGVRVFGPGGEQVPAWAQPEVVENPAAALWDSQIKPEARPEGLVIVVPRVPDSLGLSLRYGGPSSVQHLRARLEGSDDGETWRPLGEEDLFENPASFNGGSEPFHFLVYPSGQDLYLRITIPAAEASSPFSMVVVHSLPHVLSVPTDRPDCESTHDVTSCLLMLPARGQRPVRLDLDLAGPREVAVRVYAAEKGAWRLLIQGIRRATQAGSRFSIPLVTRPLEGQALRIELRGVEGMPRVVRASLEFSQPVVVFRAGSPGHYELHYGDGRSYEGGRNDSPPSQYDESAWIAPGPESARGLPPLPRSAFSPTVPLDGRFAAAWPVKATGARPGDVVRLEMPAEVYAHSQSFGSDLRLSTGDLQIPYIRQATDDPAPALARQGLRPQRPFIGEDRVYVRLLQPGLPLTTWQVTCGSQARDRQEVQVSFPFQEGGGGYGMAHGKTDPLLPCRLDGNLKNANPRASELKLTASAPVDLALWRRRDVLVFVWPGKGPVVLRTGGPAGAPQYDLEILKSDLLARPWRAAALGPKEPEVHLLRLLALLAGAGVALLLLRKALPDG